VIAAFVSTGEMGISDVLVLTALILTSVSAREYSERTGIIYTTVYLESW
jgi:hypothetical protein